jgi:cytochrome c556
MVALSCRIFGLREVLLMIRPALFALLLACGAAACVPARDLTVEQMSHVQRRRELMDAFSTIADPQFKKRDQQSFTDAEIAALADVGTRLQAGALHLKDFSKGPQYDALAVRLHDHAAELVDSATAKDPVKLRNTLGEIKATCRECHKKFR